MSDSAATPCAWSSSARATTAFAMIAFWGGLVLVAYMALTPLQHAATASISHKLQHVAAFFYLTAAMWCAYRYWLPLHRMAALLFGYGLGIEIIQAVIPYRSFELLDLTTDAAGIGLAAACVVLLGPASSLRRAATGRWSAPAGAIAAIAVIASSASSASGRRKPR